MSETTVALGDLDPKQPLLYNFRLGMHQPVTDDMKVRDFIPQDEYTQTLYTQTLLTGGLTSEAAYTTLMGRLSRTGGFVGLGNESSDAFSSIGP